MAETSTRDFFISYAQADRRWAEWIAWQLEEARFTAVLQAWDFRPGANFVLDIQHAATRAQTTLAVLSTDYMTSDFSQSEWAAAFARDPSGDRGSLLPVRVGDVDAQGILGSIVYLDLVGLDEAASRERLLAAASNERGKPRDAPQFPGTARRSVSGHPPFPGHVGDTARSRKPAALAEPRYRDARSRELAEALERCYLEREEQIVAGGDPGPIDAQILDLRRELRQGGRLQAGDILAGRCRLIEPIGKGGFASVWKALDRGEHDLVAVKVLHGQHAEDRTLRERFYRGARRMGALRHSGVVAVMARDLEDEGHHFFVMEFVDGLNLHEAVLSSLPGFEERIGILLDTGEALQFAHDEGLIHRDIKPSNILLEGGRRPKLSDFDLVRASDTTGGTRTGMLGSAVYAAPEAMVHAGSSGTPADVYSFAMTAIFTLAGKEIGLEIIRDPARFIGRLGLPPTIARVLERGVEWEVRDRYPSVEAFCEALHDAASADPTPPRFRLFRRLRTALGPWTRRVPRSRAAAPTAVLEIAQSRDMTVLFSDVRSFTTLSEGLEPAELSELMRLFLTPLTEVIQSTRGTIDKFMGDAIMAFWGAPDADPDHARHALEAALGMLETMDLLAPELERRGFPAIRIGVGLNTGSMTVGDMGSATRTSYTVLGDAVNLGSRLEGLTKAYGVQAIVGETTRDRVPDHEFRELDRVRVKGKDAPYTVYEPLGPCDDVNEPVRHELALHRRALEYYRDRSFDMAERWFLQLAEEHPEDTLYRVYLERITYYRESAPAPDWDGVFTHRTK